MTGNHVEGPACGGLIAGLTIKVIRGSVSITQAQLAELLAVDLSTVKGWESGRRPLAHARATDVAALRFQLQLLGGTPDQLAVLDEAMRADWLLEKIETPGGGSHPLAHQVVTRDTNQLLAWPLTGAIPGRLGGGTASPVLGAGQREYVHGSLRSAVEECLARPTDKSGPLLRRNAYYLLADDADSHDWLRATAGAEKRRMPRLDHWTPEWVLHRSLAVSQAVAGDREPLRQFLDRGMTSDDTLAASLNYWAAWCGDDHREYHSDEFMASDLGRWRGDVLLGSLAANLVTTTPYLELCIRALWALLARRPQLLDDPAAAGRLRARVTALLDTPGGLAHDSQAELQQILYALNWRRS